MLYAYFLVGLPGSGKSTWVKKFNENYHNVVISTDDYIERAAAKAGQSYNEAFKGAIDAATQDMAEQLAYAIENEKTIIWDQTNLTVKSRKPKVEKLMKAGYEVVAVVFEISPAEIYRRRALRSIQTDKTIPSHVLQSMAASYVRPTVEEGFTKVIVINDFDDASVMGEAD